jgi:acyl-CoA dehydrogenase
MDFAFDKDTEELRERLLAFMDEHVYPAEAVLEEQLAAREDPWSTAPVVRVLQEKEFE